MPTTSYRNAAEFPYEAFVQRAIEAYFAGEGYRVEDGGFIDLVCFNPRLEQRWIIEAKGQTRATGLDFRTCLGQLLQAMHDPSALYGIALPDTPNFIDQCRKVSDRVREALRMHWLLVSADGSVRIIGPNEALG